MTFQELFKLAESGLIREQLAEKIKESIGTVEQVAELLSEGNILVSQLSENILTIQNLLKEMQKK